MGRRSTSEPAGCGAGAGIIRLAAEPDLPAVVACVEAAFAAAGAGTPALAGPSPAELEALTRRGSVHLLETDGTLEGVIVLEPFEDHLFVVALAVAPGRRRQGVGRRLVAFAESEARRRQLHTLRLYTDRRLAGSRAFYARLGFRPDAADPGSAEGTDLVLARVVAGTRASAVE